jgi:hypothetical protein
MLKGYTACPINILAHLSLCQVYSNSPPLTEEGYIELMIYSGIYYLLFVSSTGSVLNQKLLMQILKN